MKDLRKAAEMALEGFEQIYRSCGFVEEEQKKLHKHAKELSTCVKQDCKNYMEQLRQALAQEESELTRPRSEKPWVKTYFGGKPNYCTPEVTPDVDAVNMSQERVDETAKCKREWVGLTEDEALYLLPVGEWEVEPTLVFAKAIEAKLKEKNT